jgi:putative sterol carrier protein
MARIGTARNDPTDVFFADLASRRHEPLLHAASGTLRFDLTEGAAVGHVLVTVKRGDVHVSRMATRADTVLRAERWLFNGMVEGRVNAIAAFLRGDLAVDGDLALMTWFVRLFAGPTASRVAFDQEQQGEADG